MNIFSRKQLCLINFCTCTSFYVNYYNIRLFNFYFVHDKAVSQNLKSMDSQTQLVKKSLIPVSNRQFLKT